MLASNRTARLAATLALALATIASTPAFAQNLGSIRESPFSDLSNGTYSSIDMHAPFNDRFKTYMHNDSVSIKRSRFQQRLTEGQMAAEASPNLHVSIDRSADQSLLLTKLARQTYFPDQTPQEVYAYIKARFADYDKTMKIEAMPSLNVGSSCTYLVESLYEVGAHVRVDPEQRRDVRVGCIVAFVGAQEHGKLQSNAARQALVQFMAASGSTFRDLYTAGDAAKREKLSAEARSTFKQFFGSDVAKYEPDRFPCFFAAPGESCDTIMAQRPQFDALIERYS